MTERTELLRKRTKKQIEKKENRMGAYDVRRV